MSTPSKLSAQALNVYLNFLDHIFVVQEKCGWEAGATLQVSLNLHQTWELLTKDFLPSQNGHQASLPLTEVASD